MSYPSDSIDWQIVERVDEWLDYAVAPAYMDQPLAQDWARVAKVGEELGEAIRNLIGMTGQNPRKGFDRTSLDLVEELADTALTAIFAIQHFTKNTSVTRQVLRDKQLAIHERVPK